MSHALSKLALVNISHIVGWWKIVMKCYNLNYFRWMHDVKWQTNAWPCILEVIALADSKQTKETFCLCYIIMQLTVYGIVLSCSVTKMFGNSWEFHFGFRRMRVHLVFVRRSWNYFIRNADIVFTNVYPPMLY